MVYSFYDAMNSDNTSKYTIQSGSTLVYDATENAYRFTIPAGHDNFAMISDYDFNSDIDITLDVKMYNSGNVQSGIRFGNLSLRAVCLINKLTLSKIDDGNLITQSDYSNQYGVWYTLHLRIKNGVFTGEIIKDETVLSSYSVNVSSYISSKESVGLFIAYNNNSYYYAKNLKVMEI